MIFVSDSLELHLQVLDLLKVALLHERALLFFIALYLANFTLILFLFVLDRILMVLNLAVLGLHLPLQILDLPLILIRDLDNLILVLLCDALLVTVVAPHERIYLRLELPLRVLTVL